MVMLAKEHPLGEVGSAALYPGCDVVRLAPGGWPIAAGEEASTVSGREPDPLTRGEPPLLTAHVDRRAIGGEEHRHDPRLADMPLDGSDADRDRLSFESAAAGATCEVAFGDEHAHRRRVCGKHHGVCLDAETHQLHEGVQSELLGGPLVAHKIFGT